MTGQNQGPILVVTGLAAEAKLLRGPDMLCVSAPPAFLPDKLERVLADHRPSAIVSFGLAGGLAPALRPGAIVLATAVATSETTWRCDAGLQAKLFDSLVDCGESPVKGLIAACDAPVMTRAAKAELRKSSGAVAVDTESHIAARCAERAGLPFAVLRAVTDTAESDLPPLAVTAIDAEGRLDIAAIAAELRRSPAQLLLLPGTALATTTALRALGRVRRRLGARLGL